MFTKNFRDYVQEWILQLASTDPRIIAGAVVGSLALDEGDRWSDLDLTFAVDDQSSIYEVLEDWTGKIVNELEAVKLFDLPSGPSIYRVFLLPGSLQFDLSFTPASQFGAVGPMFRLLFGQAVERPFVQPPKAPELFGYAVHHLLRARFCIERGRYWQAEYWISLARDYALSLACLDRGLPTHNGRGFDALPLEVRDRYNNALVKSIEKEQLMRALRCVVAGLLQSPGGALELATKVRQQLQELTQEWELP